METIDVEIDEYFIWKQNSKCKDEFLKTLFEDKVEEQRWSGLIWGFSIEKKIELELNNEELDTDK